MGFSPLAHVLVMASGQPSKEEGKNGVALDPAEGVPPGRTIVQPVPGGHAGTCQACCG